jgi:hypothetical protein
MFHLQMRAEYHAHPSSLNFITLTIGSNALAPTNYVYSSFRVALIPPNKS